MNVENMPPLRDSLEAHGLLAKKSFGQHFLLDLNITRKIARLAGPLEGQTVIEVGPGPGGLTRALLEAGAKVIAVEMDPRFLPLLEELREASGDALTVIQGDALKVDEAALAPDGAHVISNLPYNVGTALLIKWLTGPWRPLSMTLMFQKEVADRIAAQVGDDAYGRLAVIAQTIASAKVVMDLPPRAFTPPPKVSSAVVRLDPLKAPPPADLVARLERVSAAAFGQRRKMLRSSLKALGGADMCERAGIEPDARAETVDIAGFLRLAAALD
jgi:16S rRNA (adenine1518-N6/adenine1519-N6)-dimethyltransferase